MDPHASAVTREHGGERYASHDAACADLFDADPEYYAEKQREIDIDPKDERVA